MKNCIIIAILAFALDCFAQAPLQSSPEPAKNVETLNQEQEVEGSGQLMNYAWPPLLSFFLPGFDQWYEGRNIEAMSFTGIFIASNLWAFSESMKIQKELEDGFELDFQSSFDDRFRSFTYASSLSLATAFVSGYDSFRHTVQNNKKYGQFEFIDYQESVPELLLSAFDFRYLARPTTYIPLLIGLGLHLAIPTNLYQESFSGSLFPKDIVFATGISLNAGVGEEAFFRGYLMPALTQWWSSPLWANIAQTAVFGALHISNGGGAGPFQAVGGFYWGWLTQRNGWSIGEAAFGHFWWDVLVLSAGLYRANINSNEIVWLPKISLVF